MRCMNAKTSHIKSIALKYRSKNTKTSFKQANIKKLGKEVPPTFSWRNNKAH